VRKAVIKNRLDTSKVPNFALNSEITIEIAATTGGSMKV
jgi:hypothetical protein